MGEQHTVYWADDEEDMAEWVETKGDIFGGRSELYKRAVRILKEEKQEAIDELTTDEGTDTLI